MPPHYCAEGLALKCFFITNVLPVQIMPFSLPEYSEIKFPALLEACRGGSLARVKYLVEEQHVDPHSCKDDDKNSPLHWASLYRHSDIVRYLVEEQNCDVECRNMEGVTPLHYTASFDLMQYFIIDRHCDPKCEDRYGQNSLHWACGEFPNLDVVKFLIETGNVDASRQDSDGNTPLSLVVEYGTRAITKYLVEKQPCALDICNRDGLTPLHKAVEAGNIDVIRYLISEKGCNPELKTRNGATPLEIACRRCRVDIVKYLIEEVKVDYQCREGEHTLLHVAASCGHLAIVKLLVEDYRCNPDVRNTRVETPADCARRRKHKHITSYLSSVVPSELYCMSL